MRSTYGTTGLRKNSQGQIVSVNKKIIVFLVYASLVLDNILLTVVGKFIYGLLSLKYTWNRPKRSWNNCKIYISVPILPIFLYQNEFTQKKELDLNPPILLKKIVQDSMMGPNVLNDTTNEFIHENSRVGGLFASKAFVQLLVNPLVGKATQVYGYEVPFVTGTLLLLFSSFIFSLVSSFSWLLLARREHS